MAAGFQQRHPLGKQENLNKIDAVVGNLLSEVTSHYFCILVVRSESLNPGEVILPGCLRTSRRG